MNWHCGVMCKWVALGHFVAAPGARLLIRQQTQAKAGGNSLVHKRRCVSETLHQSSDRAPRRTAGELSHAVVSLAVKKLAL